MVSQIDLNIDELMLDLDNPRIGGVESQSAALEAIVNLNEAHFRNLMNSIKQHGLDPGDSLYVIEGDNGDYIVLEGNRRTSALKVLRNPELLKGTNLPVPTTNRLKSVAADFDVDSIEILSCVIFEDREEANAWIQRRHTGTSEGEGRIQWSPLEIQRFTGNNMLLDVLDFVERNAGYPPEEWTKTRESLGKKSSNLARILSSSAGKNHLGLSFGPESEGNIPMVNSDPEWTVQVLSKIIEDVDKGVIDSRQFNRAADIEKYFQQLPPHLQPLAGVNNPPQPLREINLGAATTQNQKPSTPSKPKSRALPKPRTTLAEKRNPFNAPASTKGKTLLREAGLLDTEKFTLAAAFLLRAFVELAVNDYMDNHNIPKFTPIQGGGQAEIDLSKKADLVVRDIVAQGTFTNTDLRGFRNNLLTKTSPASIQSLNGFVHNQFHMPTGASLRAGWDSSIPLFIAAYGSV